MKKIFSFLLSVIFFLAVSFSAFAESPSGILGTLVDSAYTSWSEVPEAGIQLVQSYVDLFKSTDLKGAVKSIEDIPISWLKMVGTTQYVLSPFPTVAYILNESGVLEVEKSTHGGFGGRHRVGNEHDDIVVDSDILKKAINTANNEYSPKSTGKYISYRTDEWYKTKEENYCLLPLYNGGFCGERWSEIYLMPFYTDGEDRYYSEFQLHFYLERVDNENGDGWTTTFAVEWFSNFDDIDEKKGSYVIKEGMTSPEYVYLSSVIDIFQRICLFSYPSLSNALERSHSGQFQKLINFNSDFMRYYKSGDLSTYITVNNTSNYFGQHFRYEYSKHDSSCIYGSSDDIGYYYSNTPIMFSYSNIDTSKIPDSYYITVNGDTIYDYSITNPDTGQSSTINEYITNNYTYITNNNPSGDGSGSGTTGGNVTVGGNIGVNGSVNVGGEVNVGVDVSPIDINVNVSGNGGAGESGGEPPEIGGLDDLVGYLPEKSPAISQYLEIFFDTLPPELLALILAGVAVAVIKLIFRR